jgi:hypothetical protein
VLLAPAMFTRAGKETESTIASEIAVKRRRPRRVKRIGAVFEVMVI